MEGKSFNAARSAGSPLCCYRLNARAQPTVFRCAWCSGAVPAAVDPALGAVVQTDVSELVNSWARLLVALFLVLAT